MSSPEIDAPVIRTPSSLKVRGPQPHELTIQFKINGDEFKAFVPDVYVYQAAKTLAGFIVADYGDSWLIDIPTETLTSGSRIRVPDTEKKFSHSGGSLMNDT